MKLDKNRIRDALTDEETFANFESWLKSNREMLLMEKKSFMSKKRDTIRDDAIEEALKETRKFIKQMWSDIEKASKMRIGGRMFLWPLRYNGWEMKLDTKLMKLGIDSDSAHSMTQRFTELYMGGKFGEVLTEELRPGLKIEKKVRASDKAPASA